MIVVLATIVTAGLVLSVIRNSDKKDALDEKEGPIPAECDRLDDSARKVTVEGVGSISSFDRGRARDEAIRDAFRRAVEQAVEVLVTAETYVENFQVIRDNIISRAEGYIVCYNVRKETIEKDFYRVTLEALVLPSTLKLDLFDLHIMIKDVIGNPRVMIMIDEQNLGEKQHFSIIESKLRTLFSDKGFYLVDQEQIDKIRVSEMARKALAGDMNAALALALESDLNSDIIILGKASTTLLAKDISGSPMDSAMAQADIRVVITQSAQNVGNFYKESKGLSTTEQAAGNEALANLAAELGNDLLQKTIDAFNIAAAGRVRSVRVVVTGVHDFLESDKLAQWIGNLRGVERVSQRSFGGGTATLDVDVRIATRDFAIRLQHVLGLKVTAYTMNTIAAEVVR